MIFLLSKENFEKNIRPKDDMTYGEIKTNIFEKYGDIIKELDIILEESKKLIEEDIVYLKYQNGFLKSESYKYINITYGLFVFHLKGAYTQTHIEGDYGYYIFAKCVGFKSACIFWQSLIDKIAYLVFEVDSPNGLKDIQNEKYIQVEARAKFDSYKKLEKAIDENKIGKYSIREMTNFIKHKRDDLSELIHRIFINSIKFKNFKAADIQGLEAIFANFLKILPKNLKLLCDFLKRYTYNS